MKILHCNGFSKEESEFYKGLIRANLIDNMKSLLDANTTLQIGLSDNDQELASKFLDWYCLHRGPANSVKVEIPVNILECVKALWESPDLKVKTMDRSSEFHIPHSAAFFFL